MSGSLEHDRIIGNLLMFGVVAELDEAKALVRVDVDGMRTDWIPWAATRAGPGMRVWAAPEVGEQVVIASPYGDPAQGVVLGSVYRTDYPAPATARTVARAEFADGTIVEYDRVARRLTIDVGAGIVVVNCATATVTAAESVTFDTPSAHFTGDVSADGNITTQREVTAGDIGLKAHHHTAQGATAPTTPAQA